MITSSLGRGFFFMSIFSKRLLLKSTGNTKYHILESSGSIFMNKISNYRFFGGAKSISEVTETICGLNHMGISDLLVSFYPPKKNHKFQSSRHSFQN